MSNHTDNSPVEFHFDSKSAYSPRKVLEIGSPRFNEATQLYESTVVHFYIDSQGVEHEQNLGMICSPTDVGANQIVQIMYEITKEITKNQLEHGHDEYISPEL